MCLNVQSGKFTGHVIEDLSKATHHAVTDIKDFTQYVELKVLFFSNQITMVTR